MRTKISVALLFAATAACSHHRAPPPLVPEAALDQKKPAPIAEPAPEPTEETIPQPSEDVLAGRTGTLETQKSPIPSHAMAMLTPVDGYKVSGTFIVDESLGGSDVKLDLQGVPQGKYTVNLQDDECGSASAKATAIGSVDVGEDGLARFEATVPDAWSSLVGRTIVLMNQYEAQLACGTIIDLDMDKSATTPDQKEEKLP